VAHQYNKNFHFNNAKTLLKNDDLQSIRYACLELRYFIEAHVYERLYRETEILPKQVIDTWQPNKAIKFLSMFDELADKDLVLSTHDNDGNKVTEIKYNNLSIKELNKLYNSLGSYLHLPMPKKASTYTIKKAKIIKIFDQLERVTNGNLMIVSKAYDKFSCQACGSDIVFTRKYAEENDSIKCQNDNCGIEHAVKVNDTSVEFGAKYIFDCGGCNEQVSIFHSHIKDLYAFQCDSCEMQYKFELTLRGIAKNET
jgi:transcription elongation factor Elf1